MAVTYLDQAADKRARQFDAIPVPWRLANIPAVDSVPNALDYIRDSHLLTPKELEITKRLGVAELLAKMAKRELSALEVTMAFAKRAAFAHQLTTCLTEIFFDEAFARAIELDNALATTGKTVGPLHGLPVSVKDCVGIKGVDSTLGSKLPSTSMETLLTSNRVGWFDRQANFRRLQHGVFVEETWSGSLRQDQCSTISDGKICSLRPSCPWRISVWLTTRVEDVRLQQLCLWTVCQYFEPKFDLRWQ